MAGGWHTVDPACEPEFSVDVVDRVRELVLQGASSRQIAEDLGVRLSTLSAWRKAYPIFGAAWASWQEHADEDVERALWMHALSDPGAAKYWLQARRPAQWNPAQRVEAEGSQTVTIVTGVPAADG